MAIRQKTLNIFDADVEVIVIPVNTRGDMGRGLALQFKWRFEEAFEYYRKVCRAKQFGIDKLMSVVLPNGQRALFFPTKADWWDPSKKEWVEANVTKLAHWCKAKGINTLAIPPVGCGEGGLDFDVVRDMLFSAFDEHPTDVVFTVSAGNYRRVAN